MSLSPDLANQAHAAGSILIILAVAVVVVLWLLHLSDNHVRRLSGQPRKTTAQHVRTHAGHHVGAGIAVALGVALLLGVGAAALVLHRGGGALWRNHHPKAPDYRLVRAGSGGPAVSADLSAYMHGRVFDQGLSSACGNHALIEAIMITLRAQGYSVPDLSPWQNAYYGEGNSAAGSSIDQDVRAVNEHGVETFAGWPTQGGPDATDAAHTFSLQVTYVTLFNGSQGYAGLAAVKGALDQGEVVILLHRTYDGEYNAYGQSQTDNGGGLHFRHFFDAVQHQGDVVRNLNSWTGSYGRSGIIGFTPTAFLNTVDAAYTIRVSHVPAAWLPAPPPTATPTPRTKPSLPPTKTATPHSKTPPPPSSTPVRRTPPPPTPVPVAAVIHHAANLRVAPAKGARILQGLPAGTHVLDLRRGTTHWEQIRARATGWVLKTVLH